MKKGFSLVEVLVALFIVMIMFVGVIKISILSLRAKAYSEAVTYAAVLGHAKLVFLEKERPDSGELKPDWHQDGRNPIVYNSIRFYRFWQVSQVEAGKRVELYTAWVDPSRGDKGNPMSASNIRGGLVPCIVFSDTIFEE